MELDFKLVKGQVLEVKTNIYAAVIPNGYDRAMLFCKYQEFYESPFENIKGKIFSMEEFMKIYTERDNSDTFNYPNHWAGFNVPSHILTEASETFLSYYTNDYDLIMKNIIYFCNNNSGPETPWYLIGIDKKDSDFASHEMAHAYYYVNSYYKLKMNELVEQIEPKDFQYLKSQLIDCGYCDEKELVYDEIQAYMSTGNFQDWKIKIFEKYNNSFKEIFNKYHLLETV